MGSLINGPRKWGCDSGRELEHGGCAAAALTVRTKARIYATRAFGVFRCLMIGALLFALTATLARADRAFTVGSGGDFSSLTNTGGAFDWINQNRVSENLIINIVFDLANEMGVVPLNGFAGGFTVLIKPSGAPRTVTGAGDTQSQSLIKLHGADNVTIDGSLSAGSDRSLTLTFTRADAGGVVVWIASASASVQTATRSRIASSPVGRPLDFLRSRGYAPEVE